MAKQTEKTKKTVFETLSAINVNDKTEKKNNLTYLSWAWAWGKVKELYPDASYTVEDVVGTDGVSRPYLFDPVLGYLVRTTVTIEGDTIPMQLPVLDGANKAMKDVKYKYTTRYGEREVESATMFDINTSIMRCLTKNIAMHGLGFYIYAGEDLPEAEKSSEPVKQEKTTVKAGTDKPKSSAKVSSEFKSVDEVCARIAVLNPEEVVKDFIKKGGKATQVSAIIDGIKKKNDLKGAVKYYESIKHLI